MATARWFYEPEPDSRYVIQEHLRQGYWRNGPAALWLDVTSSRPPYQAVGYWHSVTFELEWVPLEFVRLTSNEPAPELERVTSLQLGFRATKKHEEGGRHVVEWRLDPDSVPEVVPPVSATPVIDTDAVADAE